METVQELLEHYFRTVFEAAGLRWSNDNSAEIATLVSVLSDSIEVIALQQARDVANGLNRSDYR